MTELAIVTLGADEVTFVSIEDKMSRDELERELKKRPATNPANTLPEKESPISIEVGDFFRRFMLERH